MDKSNTNNLKDPKALKEIESYHKYVEHEIGKKSKLISNREITVSEQKIFLRNVS